MTAPPPVFTPRLRLEPITEGHALDLWRLHDDASIARWYGGAWTREEADRRAAEMAGAWKTDGVSKWIAYGRENSELIGRGGLSWKNVDGERRLEVGWAVIGRLWGEGYATEIGHAGLEFGFGHMRAAEIVAFTETDNARSRAVMERLRMRYLRDIEWEGDPFALYSIAREEFDEPLTR